MVLVAIKGAILEELVLHLLKLVGYSPLIVGDEGTQGGHSGLELEGRGEWHQIDAAALLDHSPAFMYPLRLLVEAKCYAEHRRIGIDVVRNAVGVLKDISENYFNVKSLSAVGSTLHIKTQRYNYQSAIFSTSGYSRGATQYAVAHQIFLIQYERVALFKPAVEGLRDLTEEHFDPKSRSAKEVGQKARMYVRALLARDTLPSEIPFSVAGLNYLNSRLIEPIRGIKGSYFGMLQGKWPMHLLSPKPLPQNLFATTDVLKCRVYGRESTSWSFVPLNLSSNDENWFRLEFDLPEEIAELVKAAEGDKATIANVKMSHFSFISVSGLIGGIRRQVRLELDEEWIGAYLQRVSVADAATSSRD
ncbi:hypothetical protein [Rhodoferax ferrireducens]|uniref:hypothetical protein n=1 Tax=Rhodoferax ferrireducens TaxID=192843 RepID=UPI000E0D392A|nr:hypothetical protein [Rhodoferax ferrireducens]